MTKKGSGLLIALITSCALVLQHPPESLGAEKTLHVLVSTFPIYQITRNVTAGADRLQVELMIPAQLGCPHDYALAPQDMQKLAKADVLIINGLGMEEFLGAPLNKAHPGLKLIDSSQGVEGILNYKETETEEHAHQADHEHQHHANAPNPHLFASPRMSALVANSIAAQLSAIDPAGAKLYAANAQAYGQRMQRLFDDCATLGKRLKNNRIATQHGVFDYLARDMGLEVVAVVEAHAGQEPSAGEMLAIIAAVKQEKAGAIFTEPQYPEAVGKTIAKEAGIVAATLDPVANGPEQAPLDYFEKVMRTNLITLEKTLGTK
jgi:ABC-type Zn uptake system ZnuABC Zn-binding protein ZnuA